VFSVSASQLFASRFLLLSYLSVSTAGPYLIYRVIRQARSFWFRFEHSVSGEDTVTFRSQVTAVGSYFFLE